MVRIGQKAAVCKINRISATSIRCCASARGERQLVRSGAGWLVPLDQVPGLASRATDVLIKALRGALVHEYTSGCIPPFSVRTI
jgi:hypothetical protein